MDEEEFLKEKIKSLNEEWDVYKRKYRARSRLGVCSEDVFLFNSKFYYIGFKGVPQYTYNMLGIKSRGSHYMLREVFNIMNEDGRALRYAHFTKDDEYIKESNGVVLINPKNNLDGTYILEELREFDITENLCKMRAIWNCTFQKNMKNVIIKGGNFYVVHDSEIH